MLQVRRERDVDQLRRAGHENEQDHRQREPGHMRAEEQPAHRRQRRQTHRQRQRRALADPASDPREPGPGQHRAAQHEAQDGIGRPAALEERGGVEPPARDGRPVHAPSERQRAQPRRVKECPGAAGRHAHAVAGLPACIVGKPRGDRARREGAPGGEPERQRPRVGRDQPAGHERDGPGELEDGPQSAQHARELRLGVVMSERVEEVRLVGPRSQGERDAVDGARNTDQREPGRVDVSELGRRGEEPGGDQEPPPAESVGQRAGRHLRDQHPDVERRLDKPELRQREAAREQEDRPDRAGEDDAVEELVEAKDGERAGVHGTSRTRIDGRRRAREGGVWAHLSRGGAVSALLVRHDVPQQPQDGDD